MLKRTKVSWRRTNCNYCIPSSLLAIEYKLRAHVHATQILVTRLVFESGNYFIQHIQRCSDNWEWRLIESGVWSSKYIHTVFMRDLNHHTVSVIQVMWFHVRPPFLPSLPSLSSPYTSHLHTPDMILSHHKSNICSNYLLSLFNTDYDRSETWWF